MKICFLTERLLKGYGVDLVVHNQATLLSQKGHEVHVLTPSYDSEYYKNTFYKISVMPYNYNFKNMIRYLSVIKKEKFEYVVAHTPDFYFILPFINKYAKTVVYEYGTPNPEFFPDNIRTGLKNMIENKRKYLYTNVNAVFSISNFIREETGFNSNVSRTVYIGSDHYFNSIKPLDNNYLTSNDNKIKILQVCRLGGSESNYKGLDIYKKFTDYMRARSNNYEFFIAGKGTVSDKDYLEKHGFKVVLSPTDEEIQACYNSCDVFVHFSKWEGFNLPLAEAEWCRKPVLATANGAHPEVTPFTFGTYKEMADFILANSTESLKEIGEKCFSHVQKFTWNNNIIEFEKALLDIKNINSKSIKFSYYWFFSMYYFIKPPIRKALNVLLRRK